MKTLREQQNFETIALKLASPESIKEWSYGEVTKPETINYRTQRSERGGLFDERIFGPEKDYECYCGKYKRIRYKNIICEKCGVEVTRSIVRRERMGHIELASPVAHIWFLRSIPSRMGLLLNLPIVELEKVIYFAGYIITSVNIAERDRIMKELDHEYKTKLKTLTDEKGKEKLKELLLVSKHEIESLVEGKVLGEMIYHKFALKYGTAFEAGIGAEAIYNIFKKIDMVKFRDQLEALLEKAGAVERAKLHKRLGIVKSMINSGVRPEWMFITVIPIIPPALRPMVALEGGRHATSDLNDLYRRVINRNNRLKKLQAIGAPDVILRNEKRILQEAVDSLIDNSIRRVQSVAMNQAQKRTLKSLADTLKGKQGLFRQNLLGKRVDYSGRSVIVVGPKLHLNQCGLPKHMALELFRPFIVSEILTRELAYNIRGANKLIDESVPEVWAILEEVIKGKYVLLNRAPTLHRLGIQAFHPILIEGNAIQVHPLVCTAFNADFDGDQMAVHVPLSRAAQEEAGKLMAANKNLLGPGNGDPIVNPKLDIPLGCYSMTKIIDGAKGEGKIFPTPNSAITAHDFDIVSYRAKIKVMGTDSPKYAIYEGKVFETTVGRLLFNSVLPKDFAFVNKEITKKELESIIDEIISIYGIDATLPILDKIKDFGFKYVSKSGITWGIDEIKVPAEKKGIIAKARVEADEVRSEFNEGLLSEEERYRRTIEVWQGARAEIEKFMPATLEKNGSVEDMLKSGARGSYAQILQMGGMTGLIINTAGRTIDFPIIPSSKEGLSPVEYFITTHGSRKGLADTALQTAKAGYLTRRIVDVAQDAIITEEDCGDKDGKVIRKENLVGFDIPLSRNLKGRVLIRDMATADGTVIYKKGHLMSKLDAKNAEAKGITEAMVRSPLSCKTSRGICRKCYGLDIGRNELVEIGEAVGIIAAQAIGEPGTQLTMRTFHSGGIASAGGDITMGLPRVEEIFEKREPKSLAIISHTNGVVTEVLRDEKELVIKVLPSEGEGKKKGEVIPYETSAKRTPFVKVGDTVAKGQLLSDGSADIGEVFQYAGKDVAENYIITEVQKIYELQGASISRKHIEVIIRQMFSRRKIKDVGDTKFNMGEVVEQGELTQENERIEKAGGEKAKGEIVVLGISVVALTTKSWLSAASFENTTRVLIDTAINGGVDTLRGLKENVIIGHLIPAGTGFGARSGVKELPGKSREEGN
ncbi:MAG: DNA-directed RNA polymerase subunit beta' [Candidatus Yonathbacteria bacterium]|nr:DNA-directed RNA polymerase subunit beta' [Candidatus Yonathbacteria bacterium]